MVRLIVDFSQMAHSTFHGSVRFDKDLTTDEERFAFHKYMMLNSIQKLIKRYSPNEVILAMDSSSWRKDYFTYYKAKRALKRAEADFDVQRLYDAIDGTQSEIRENFPYKVIKVNGAEGDDIIAVLTENLAHTSEKIVISSRDKDFKQLLRYGNVVLFDAIADKELECEDPARFLLEHLLTGDSSDGIPNLLSPDNIFLSGQRQKPCTKKVKQEFFEDPDKYVLDNGLTENWERNRRLIELTGEQIPTDVVQGILEAYSDYEAPNANELTLLRYFRKHKMVAFADDPTQFLLTKAKASSKMPTTNTDDLF